MFAYPGQIPLCSYLQDACVSNVGIAGDPGQLWCLELLYGSTGDNSKTWWQQSASRLPALHACLAVRLTFAYNLRCNRIRTQLTYKGNRHR